MRKHADWMAQPDDRILELLHGDGPHHRWEIREALKTAGRDMEYPKKYLEFRTASLLTHGLIKRQQDGRLEIADRGRDYLTGDLDAGELDEDANTPDPALEDNGGNHPQ